MSERYNLTWIEDAINDINKQLKSGFSPVNTKIKRHDNFEYKLEEARQKMKDARYALVQLWCYPNGLTKEAFAKFLSNDSILISSCSTEKKSEEVKNNENRLEG